MLKINETKKENVGAGPVSAHTMKTRRNNGITLIALIITIIVMLILVGVTITVAVNGGLFNYAGRATGETKNAIAEEQELAEGKITIDGQTYNSIDEYIKGQPVPNPEEKFSSIYAETKEYTDETGTAIIPKGFAVGTSEGINKVGNGLVITDAVNSSGNSTGNEFVWIPVEKAIVTESEIAKIIADSGNTEMTSLDAVKSLVASGTYPMAVQDGTNYKGILYGFTHNSDNTLTLSVRDWTSTAYTREPAVLSGYDTQENFTTYGLGTYSPTLYQDAYNKMVQSVAKNGGFYVGRYEISTGTYTSAEGNTITYAQSQKDQTVLDSTTWYEMYKYERDYANYNTNLGVTSEMIWGSQWDQMMIFVNGKNDGVGAKFYVAKTGSRNSGTSSSTKTGMNPVDQVANIFDLEASRHEWTQAALSSDRRAPRGAPYGSSLYASFIYHYGGTNLGLPTNSDGGHSSRASLYIK